MVERIPEPEDNRAERAPRVGDARVAPASTDIGARVSDDVVDLRYLFAALWRGKWAILALALLGGFYGLWDMRSFVPQYVASMVVAPSTSGGVSPQVSGSQFGQFMGLARGFGVNIGPMGEVTTFDRLKLVISSVTLAEILQNKYGYLQKVFAGSWDPAKKKWIRPSGKRFEWEQRVRRFLHLRTWSEPTIESLVAYVGGTVRIEGVKEAPFQRISVTHTNPDFALELLTTVYVEADELLRQQDRKETAARKAYLEEQLQRVSMMEMKAALVGLLTNEEQTAMLLQGDLPYAARVMEPAFVSSKQTEPNPVALVSLPTFLGLVGGTLLVILIAVFRRE